MKLQGKLRFVTEPDNGRYRVEVRRKSDNQWGLLGYCHLLAKNAVLSGDLSLIVAGKAGAR